MTPERHTRLFQISHRGSFVVVWVAFAVFVGAMSSHSEYAQAALITFVVLLFVMRYLPPFVWYRVKPACPECAAPMLVTGQRPVSYTCHACKHWISTKVYLTYPKASRDSGPVLPID